MEEAIKYGLMEVSMRVIGPKIKQMVEEDLFMPMVISTMDFGKMIKLMVMDNILIPMEHNMKETG